MHFSIPRQQLQQQIQRCHSIIEKRNTEMILSNIYLLVADGVLTTVGTDLQIAVYTHQHVDVKQDGSTTVSAQKFFEIVKELDANQLVEIQLQDGFLLIQSGKTKMRLSTLPADSFPNIPGYDTEMEMEIKASDLTTLISNTSFSMSNDETRKYLTGTLFETGVFGLRTVTTDGHRLSLAQCDVGEKDVCTCIVPKKTVMEMKKIADESEGVIHIAMGKRQIRLTTPSFGLTSKLIDAQFPTYQDVIPSQHPQEVVIPRVVLDQALRRSMVIANEYTHDVRMQLSFHGITIIANNQDQEQFDENIELHYQGPELIIGFNAKYLRDVLQVINGNMVRMQLRDETSPVRLLEEDSDQCQFVVMPMRV